MTIPIQSINFVLAVDILKEAALRLPTGYGFDWWFWDAFNDFADVSHGDASHTLITKERFLDAVSAIGESLKGETDLDAQIDQVFLEEVERITEKIQVELIDLEGRCNQEEN